MRIEESLVDDVVEVKGELNEDDQVRYDFINSSIESAASRTRLDCFKVELPLEVTSLEVVAAIKRTWEATGYTVGVFPITSDDKVTAVEMVLAKSKQTVSGMLPLPRTKHGTVQAAELSDKGAQPSTTSAPAFVRHLRLGRELLVRMPTRRRPAQAIETLTAYRKLAEKHVPIEVVIDADDESMLDTRVQQRLSDLDVFVCVDTHGSKVAAVNGGRQDDWQAILLASDDMVPYRYGYDQVVMRALRQHFPLLDGAVYFDDGYNTRNVRPELRGGRILCTLPIIGRHFYEQFGYIYYPGYGSIFCDDEQIELWSQMKRLVYVDVPPLIEHRHHAAGKAPFDETYRWNDESFGAADKKLYFARREQRRPYSQFAFNSPPLWLSILICSSTGREAMLERLLEYLRWQMSSAPRQVEILVESGDAPTGVKRNRLLERSVGNFVAFVDDDDWVCHDYVKRIIEAVETNPDADCVELTGVITSNGERPEVFHHSVEHDKWETVDGRHLRYPNHLNPVRRELALQAGFPPVSYVEDRAYSDKLRPLVKTEAKIGPEPLYFYWFRSKPTP